LYFFTFSISIRMFDLLFIPSKKEFTWWKSTPSDLADEYVRELYRGGTSLYVTERINNVVVGYASLGTFDNLKYSLVGCGIVLKQNPDVKSAAYCKEAATLLKVAIKWVDEKLAKKQPVICDAGIIVDKKYRGRGLGLALTHKLCVAATSLHYKYLLFRCESHASASLVKKVGAKLIAQGTVQSIWYIPL